MQNLLDEEGIRGRMPATKPYSVPSLRHFQSPVCHKSWNSLEQICDVHCLMVSTELVLLSTAHLYRATHSSRKCVLEEDSVVLTLMEKAGQVHTCMHIHLTIRNTKGFKHFRSVLKLALRSCILYRKVLSHHFPHIGHIMWRGLQVVLMIKVDLHRFLWYPVGCNR